jgi:hypothetical protein
LLLGRIPPFDQYTRPWVNGEFLWCFLPAFVDCREPVEIVQASHALWTESRRLFGLDANDPCRLEMHNGFPSKLWTSFRITPVVVLSNAVPVYNL